MIWVLCGVMYAVLAFSAYFLKLVLFFWGCLFVCVCMYVKVVISGVLKVVWCGFLGDQ